MNQINLNKQRFFSWSRNGFPMGLIQAESFLEAAKKAVAIRIHQLGEDEDFALHGVSKYDQIVECIPRVWDEEPIDGFFRVPDRWKRSKSLDYPGNYAKHQEHIENMRFPREDEEIDEVELVDEVIVNDDQN